MSNDKLTVYTTVGSQGREKGRETAIMPSAAECSKPGLDRALGFDFGLSGVTPGDRDELRFRRVSVTARLRSTAHAR